MNVIYGKKKLPSPKGIRGGGVFGLLSTVNGSQICSKEKAEAQKCGTMRNTLITTTFHSAFLEDNVTRSEVAQFGVVVMV